MHSIIVVPVDGERPGAQIRLAPSESLSFGRTARPGTPHLTIAHEGVSREAGQITATGAYWTLSNLSRAQTYVVENPEGSRRAHQDRAGAAGRAGAVRVLAGGAARRERVAQLRRLGPTP